MAQNTRKFGLLDRVGHTLTPTMTGYRSRRISWLSTRGLFIWLTLGALFVGGLAAIQFSTPDLADNDGFYHIKYAYLLRTEGLKPAFPWLPLSILNPREFYDHHFLFHVALIPFTFGDLITGAKWASVFFAALAFLTTWRLLESQRVPYAALWSLGLFAVSVAFLYRMSIPRAQSLSLVVLITGLNWLLAKKYARLGILGFIYVWLYNAFPLLPVVAGIYSAAVYMIERRVEWRPLLYTVIGTLAGLVINPYFPYDVVFAVQHIFPKVLETTMVSVGNEWYPYDTAQLLSNSPLTLLGFLSGVVALGLNGRRMDVRTGTSLLLVGLFGFMLFQSRRFIEYFPPFVLLFSAFAWSALIKPVSGERRWNLISQRLPALALIVILAPSIWSTVHSTQASLQRSKPFGLYAGASAWLAANSPAGSRIFQTDWDDFPRLFFYNTHNTYLIGLDPTYLQLYNSELYDEWVQITQGKVVQPSIKIADDFRAAYVVTDLHHQQFINQAGNDPGLIEVYRDGEAVVYAVDHSSTL